MVATGHRYDCALIIRAQLAPRKSAVRCSIGEEAGAPVSNCGKTAFSVAIILAAYAFASGCNIVGAVAGEQSPALLSGDTSQESSVELLIQAGDAARDSGDLERAAALYKEATTSNPRSIKAWLRLGDAEVSTKHLMEAGQAYRAADAIDSGNPETSLRLGEIAMLAGDVPAAIAEYEVALAIHEDDPRLNNSAGVAYAMEGKYDLARQHYRAALAVSPSDPNLRNNYGMLQLATGDFQGALVTFSMLTQSEQTIQRYRVNLALVYLALGRTKEALATAPGLGEAQLRQMLALYYHLYRPDADSGSQGPLIAPASIKPDVAAAISPSARSPGLPSPEQPSIPAPPANLGVPPSSDTANPRHVVLSDNSAAEKAAAVLDRSTASGQYKVQIGSVRTESEAQEEWKRLQRLYPALVSDMSLTVARADLGARGVYYRLQLGPITDAQAAAQRCAELVDHNVGCLVLRR